MLAHGCMIKIQKFIVLPSNIQRLTSFIHGFSEVVDLELVSDLSTESFLHYLKRFAARRRIPLTIYCNNAWEQAGFRRRCIKPSKGAEMKSSHTLRYPGWGSASHTSEDCGMSHSNKRVVGNALLSADEITKMLAEWRLSPESAVLNSN